MQYCSLTRWPVGSVLLLEHWSACCFLVLAWAPVAIQHCTSCRSRNGDRQDVDVAGVQHGQTAPGPRGSSDPWCSSCREYKSTCSVEFCRRHGYLWEPAYQQCGGPLCWERSTSMESWSMSHAPLYSSDEGRQGAGHKLCYHCTLSGLSCMHMQTRSITGVLSHRTHQSSGQWWAINGKLVSDHVPSFLEVVW